VHSSLRRPRCERAQRRKKRLMPLLEDQKGQEEQRMSHTFPRWSGDASFVGRRFPFFSQALSLCHPRFGGGPGPQRGAALPAGDARAARRRSSLQRSRVETTRTVPPPSLLGTGWARKYSRGANLVLCFRRHWRRSPPETWAFLRRIRAKNHSFNPLSLLFPSLSFQVSCSRRSPRRYHRHCGGVCVCGGGCVLLHFSRVPGSPREGLPVPR